MTQASREQLWYVVGIGGVSDSVLHTVLDAVRGFPSLVHEPISRRRLCKAALSIMDKVGDKEKLKLGRKDFEWEFCSPQKLLRYLCKTCPFLLRVLREVHERTHPHMRDHGTSSCSETS